MVRVPSYRLFKEKIDSINNRLSGLGTASTKDYSDSVSPGSSDLVTGDAVYQAIIDYRGLKGTITIKDAIGVLDPSFANKNYSPPYAELSGSASTTTAGDVSVVHGNAYTEYGEWKVSSPLTRYRCNWSTSAFVANMQGSGEVEIEFAVGHQWNTSKLYANDYKPQHVILEIRGGDIVAYRGLPQYTFAPDGISKEYPIKIIGVFGVHVS